MDWLAFGLPSEQTQDTIVDKLDRDIPTASVGETVGAIRSRLREDSLPLLPVLDDRNVLLGILVPPLDDLNLTTPVAEVMDPGPMTMRPSMPMEKALEVLNKQKQAAIPVTSSDGKLMGIFRRQSKAPQ